MKYLKNLSILSLSFIFQACPLQDDDDIEIGVMNLRNYLLLHELLSIRTGCHRNLF